jgi:hypothetical protein
MRWFLWNGAFIVEIILTLSPMALARDRSLASLHSLVTSVDSDSATRYPGPTTRAPKAGKSSRRTDQRDAWIPARPRGRDPGLSHTGAATHCTNRGVA